MVFGEGVTDIPNHSTKESHKVWTSMLRRAYSKVYQNKKPSYIGVTVCEEWKFYSNFLKWFNEKYVEGFQLDKDILEKGNKVYCPDKCCFVPRQINSALISKESKTDLPIGVYYKKSHNKFCAQMSKSVNYARGVGYIGLFGCPESAFNAYKEAKERHLSELAEKWKDCLEPHVYKALSEYKVEITD